jgi:hypothetical protein
MSLIFFEVMMIVALLVNAITWIVPFNGTLSDQFEGSVFAATFERTNFCAFLLMIYQLLYLLKRVEYQINPKFSTPHQVLVELRRNLIMGRIFISISALMVVFILIISIVFLASPNSHSNAIDIIYFLVGFGFFFLNLFIMYQFLKMARFYIEILVHGQEISLWQSYAFLISNMTIIFIALFRYFVHG